MMSARFLAVGMTILLAACAATNTSHRLMIPYKIAVEQGFRIAPDTLAQLKVGMTQAEVRALLGTPTLIDRLDPNRWIYQYTIAYAGKMTDQASWVLHFADEGLQQVEKITSLKFYRTLILPQPSPSSLQSTDSFKVH